MAKTKLTIDGESRGANRAIRSTGSEYDRMAAKAEKAAKAAEKTSQARVDRTKSGAEAVSRMGGQAGGLGGQVAASMGAQTRGGMMAGLGFMAAGVAVNAFTRIMEEAAQQARETIRIRNQLLDSTKSAAQAADQQAAGYHKALAKLQGLGGAGAVGVARGVAASGQQGAVEGVTALVQGKALSDMAIAAAKAAAATGQTTFGEAAKKIADGVKLTGEATRDAARVLNAMGIRGSAEDVARMQGNLRSGGGAHTYAVTQDAQGELVAALIDRAITSRGTASSLRRQAGDVRDPRAAAEREAAKNAARMAEELRAAGEAAGAMSEIMKEMGRIVGFGDGSYSRQANNVNRAYREAAN